MCRSPRWIHSLVTIAYWSWTTSPFITMERSLKYVRTHMCCSSTCHLTPPTWPNWEGILGDQVPLATRPGIDGQGWWLHNCETVFQAFDYPTIDGSGVPRLRLLVAVYILELLMLLSFVSSCLLSLIQYMSLWWSLRPLYHHQFPLETPGWSGWVRRNKYFSLVPWFL
jgi:hypothetical protein